MKILIIRFSSIGDIVLTTPIIRCVKKQVPHAMIHYLTKKKYERILSSNPYIDKHFFFDCDIMPTIIELLKEKYDVIIDLHHNLRTLYIKSMLTQAFNSNIQKFSFPKLHIRKWLYVNTPWNIMPDSSIVDRYFKTVKALGVKNDGQGLDYFIPEEDELKKDDLPMSHMLGFVACAIGGQHTTKKMPVHKWIEFCKQLDFPIILLGGEEDRAIGETIKQIDEVKIYNACGKFNLHESANIIKRSRFVITHDTGLMHIAAAFKKPILSIWGNTTPWLGMFPYYGYNNLKDTVAPNSVIFENRSLSCRPCSKIGFDACPKKHFKCMEDIPVDKLLDKAKELINTK